jgi:exodeoxyribonuclease III
MGLAGKAPSLLALRPDIAIVQECSRKSVEVIGTFGLSGLWFGTNPNKGLAVFCNSHWKIDAVNDPFGKWVVPVRVRGESDFNLLAIWACLVGTNRKRSYIAEVHRCIVEQTGWFVTAPIVVAGDFNSNSQWDRRRPIGNHTEVVRLFEDHGLVSAYHTHQREAQGTETQPTHYFHHHKNEPFHIDYVFVPKIWQLDLVEIGTFREWGRLSDHVPVVVDVSIR